MGKTLDEFKTWLHNQGAQVLDPTNPYELVRFRTANGVGIVYEGKRGRSYVGEAAEGWQKFKRGENWKLIHRKRNHMAERKAELARRDGLRCFAHNNAMHINELTVEHLLSFAQGGNDNNNNLVLVCEPANKKLANLSISQKIELIIEMRATTAANLAQKSTLSMSGKRSIVEMLPLPRRLKIWLRWRGPNSIGGNE